MDANYKVKIIMLGEKGVGKTSLMLRFCKNIFKDAQKITIIDNYNKTITLRDQKIDLELWDTAGEERYKAIVKQYFRKADGVLLTYDMTRLETFIKLSSWLNELRISNEEATVLIVGNKSDLVEENKVSRTTVEKYARDEGLEFCEASAKNNENVDEVFQNLTLKVLERKKIPPFCQLMPNFEMNGEICSNVTTNNSPRQKENGLPPIVPLEDDSVIKLVMEKPREKKKRKCC